ncbi:MAG TPA: hypothetical protein VF777_11265 [Phycisphaerales bacterium]
MKTDRARTTRLVAAALLALAPLALVACNTVSGVGQDLEETSNNTKKAFSGKSSADAGSKSSTSNDTAARN